MIHLTNNTCCSCGKTNLDWNLNHSVSKIELFKCGHGTCKKCYQNIRHDFKCPVCNLDGQLHTAPEPKTIDKWNTFAEWYAEYSVFIESGCANNIIRHTMFGKQLLRLIKENRKNIKSQKNLKSGKLNKVSTNAKTSA